MPLHQTLADDDAERATELYDRLVEDRHLDALVNDPYDGPPAWFSKLLADLTLLTSGQDLMAVFPEGDAQSGVARVVVVTARHIIEAHGSARTREARVVSRSGIREVRAEAGIGIYSETQTRWPGRVTLTITVDGFEEPLTLPLSRNTTAQPDMRVLLQAFLDNL